MIGTQQALAGERHDGLADALHINLVQLLLREHVVHGSDADDPVDALRQHLLHRLEAVMVQLEPQEARDRLQAILDPVVHLLDDRRAHHQLRIRDRDGGVVGQRRQQVDLRLGEDVGAAGVAVQDADRAVFDAQRHADQRAKPFLLRDVREAVVGRLRHVQNRQDLARLDRPSRHALPDLQVRLLHVVVAAALRRLDDQLSPVLIQQHDRADLEAHRLGRHRHDEVKDLLEVEVRGDRLADLGNRRELGLPGADAFLEAGAVDGGGGLGADGGEQADLLGIVPVRLARLHVEDADHLVLDQHGDREERLEALVLQLGEILEARVVVGFLIEHDRLPLARDPAGDPLPELQPQPPDQSRRRLVGGAQDQLAPRLVQHVDRGAVRLRHPHRGGGDELQHLLQARCRRERRRDLVQELDLGIPLLQLAAELRHLLVRGPQLEAQPLDGRVCRRGMRDEG